MGAIKKGHYETKKKKSKKTEEKNEKRVKKDSSGSIEKKARCKKGDVIKTSCRYR